jgi:hypothetical protein
LWCFLYVRVPVGKTQFLFCLQTYAQFTAMLTQLLRWRSPQRTPQEEFKRLHTTLSTPPALHAAAPSLSSLDVDSDDAIRTHTRIVDPYHFVVCQHGVLSTSADFDNVITDLFVHHEVSVMEAAELARAAVVEERERAAARFCSGSILNHNGRPCEQGKGCVEGPEMGERAAAMTYNGSLSVKVPNTFTPTVTYSITRPASPGTGRIERGDASEMHHNGYSSRLHHQQHFHPGDGSCAAHGGPADPLRPDTALTPAQRIRRDNYKKMFHLVVEHPNKTSGRLYRSGNLRVFSPGSNNYLRSDAGTLACARKMLVETVPQLHAWMDDVEARERQRRAQWAVYARTVGTPEAARLAEEAAQPLPACLSFMAHSFGGIIERECLYLLLIDTTEIRAQSAVLYDAILHLRRRLRDNCVTFENFLNIATPHCGAGECLWWPIYFGAWCLARLHLCQTYDELILSDGERVLQTRLLDPPHLKALELFRRRVLFANTHRDLLVGFGTCSLIFENVETDHTKFVGVDASATHCAAAFADDTIEISKPIILRSFAEEEEEEERRGGCPTGRRLSPAAQRTFTLWDLDGIQPISCNPAVGIPMTTLDAEDGEHDEDADAVSSDDDDSDLVNSKAKPGNTLSRTLRPQPTYSSSLAGLTASPLSVIAASASSVLATADESVFAASLTIGCNVPSHAIPVVPLEEVVGGPCGVASVRATQVMENEEAEGNNHGSSSSISVSDDTTKRQSRAPMLTVVIDPSSSSYDDFDAGCRGGPCSVSVSPVSLVARPLSVLRGSDGCERLTRLSQKGSPFALCGSPLTAFYGGCSSDSDSAVSSRRSRSSRVASVLRDPRWASEHIRNAAAAAHTEVKRRLGTAASVVLGGAPTTASGSENGMTVSTSRTTTNVTSLSLGPSPASFLIPCDDIPQYRQTPRMIAARLREKLSWRVRAVRFDNLIPVGHVACLGNWAFCGRSPMLVQSVAEELLMILD